MHTMYWVVKYQYIYSTPLFYCSSLDLSYIFEVNKGGNILRRNLYINYLVHDFRQFGL